jgi:N-acetylmuramoyl-L-alanine amidase
LRTDGVCGRYTWAALVEAGFRLGDRLLYRRAPMLRGDDVAELQKRLSVLGFDPGGVDGIFGDQTVEALADFQRNVGLLPDGICGPSTLGELARLQLRPGGADLVSLVRERLSVGSSPRTLVGRRIAVGETGGFAVGVHALCRALSAAGALPIPLHLPDPEEQAVAANVAAVDCYVGLRLEPEQAWARSFFYRGYRYESVVSRRLAELVQARLVTALELADGGTEGMALPELRGTQMPAVIIELGSPKQVVMRTVELSAAVVDALSIWLTLDWD